MPDIYDEKNAFWVGEGDDAEDFNSDGMELIVDEVEDTQFAEDDAQFVVDEDAANVGEMQFIVEDDSRDCIPGSDAVYEEEIKEDKVRDWANDGAHQHFMQYIIDKKNKIPRHSGETVPGCERAKSFLKSLDNEISKAMRTDLAGVIDEQQIDALRKEVEDMVDRLDRQIKKIQGKKKAAFDVRLFSEGHCKKCKSEAPMWHDTATDNLVCMHCESEVMRPQDLIEKTAGTPVLNVYMSAFERAVVGTMINSKVASGRNIEETYDKLKNKYNFTPREELAIQQLVADYGYPVYKDRGLLNEPSDPAAGDGVDWLTNYQA